MLYIDKFGNAMTGIRGEALDPEAKIRAAGIEICNARTFSDTLIGEPFWYVNSNGLVEIAVNQASAAEMLKLVPGSSITVSE